MFYLAARYLRESGWTTWDVLQLNGSVWLIFRPGCRAPAAVGKFYSLPDEREMARRECRSLQRLTPHADELSIPRLLFEHEDESGCFYVQAAMPGDPLRRELAPTDGRRMAAQFEKIESWLAKFQEVVPSNETLPAVFQRELKAADRRLAPKALLDAAAEALPSVPPVRAVAVHGDFFGGNVLVAGSRVSVIDWSGLHYGSPLEDLFSLATGAVFRYGQTELSAQLMRDVFLGSRPVAMQTRGAALRILARMGLPESLLRVLFLMYLITRVTRERFADAPAWRAFTTAYMAAGSPALWS